MKYLYPLLTGILALFMLSIFAPASWNSFGNVENLPPASVTNRSPHVALKFSPDYVTPNTVHHLNFRFYDSANNETFQHVSFLLSITNKNQTLLQELFHTHSGFLNIKSIFNESPNPTLVADREPILNGWIAHNNSESITMRAPLFNDPNSAYHLKVKMLTVDYDNNMFTPTNMPIFDFYLDMKQLKQTITVGMSAESTSSENTTTKRPPEQNLSEGRKTVQLVGHPIPKGVDYVVTDYQGGKLLRVTPSGKVTTIAGGHMGQNHVELEPSFCVGVQLTSCIEPNHVAMDPLGDFIVTDHLKGSLLKFPRNCIFSCIPTIIATGFNLPMGVAIDSNGDYIVADWGNGYDGELLDVKPNGNMTTIAGGLENVGSVAIDSHENFIVTDNAYGKMYNVTRNGKVTTFATNLGSLGGIAIDSNGEYIITDSSEIALLAPNGYAKTIATDLGSPYGITIDSAGNYIVVDPQAGKLLRVTPEGNVITIASKGLGFPTSVVIEPPLPYPLQQARSGTATGNITCNGDLQLIIKMTDNSPACVMPDIAQRLVDQGWGKRLNSN